MRCVTWSRDSHGLFDYQSRHIAKKNIKSSQQGRIIRLNQDVEFVSLDTNLANLPGAKSLLTITQAGEKFLIKNDSAQETHSAPDQLPE